MNRIPSSESTAIEHVKFAQRGLFHDAFVQPSTTDPEEIMELGIGRCGHASVVLAHLLSRSQIENRIVKLLKHITVEAKWDGRWHFLDADIFKNGIMPKDEDGRIPALRDVQGNYLIDRFPPSVYVYTREYKAYLDRAALLHPPFYHEPHEAGFMSHYFQMNLGIPLEYPPSRPVGLNSSVRGRNVTLQWQQSTDRDNDLTGYEVMVNDKSRGWSYFDPVYDNVPKDTSDEPTFTEETKLELKLERGLYFWSVRAIDEHRRKERKTYYFPSNEYSFEVD